LDHSKRKPTYSILEYSRGNKLEILQQLGKRKILPENTTTKATQENLIALHDLLKRFIEQS